MEPTPIISPSIPVYLHLHIDSSLLVGSQLNQCGENLRHPPSSHIPQNLPKRHNGLNSMRMMNRNIILQPRSTPRLPMNPHNLHLILTLLLIVLLFIRIPLIVLQLPLQPRNNTLNTPRPLPLLKREVPSPVPSPRLLVRFKRRPFP